MALASEKPGGNAIAALVLGILTYFGFSIITAIPAWILGKQELAAIDSGRASASGRTMAMIGMWLGIIGTILTVAVLLFWLFVAGGIAMFLGAAGVAGAAGFALPGL